MKFLNSNNDYIATGNSGTKNSDFIEKLFFEIYEFKPNPDIFFGLNLQWPKFDLPDSYTKYFLSFHTEYLHLEWVIEQAKKVYPKKIILATDYEVILSDYWPDNITTIQWITTHKQIARLLQITGTANGIIKPKYKISSLSNRISQSKKFITAYLLKHFAKSDMILTYHNALGKIEDHHGYPPEFSFLDDLDIAYLTKTLINFDDDFSGSVGPIGHGTWNNSAFTDALINLTNESFHYSGTIFNNKPDYWPGPYITEKTFKPLLAGRPLLAVGQYQTYEYLTRLGFDVNFGFDCSYDQDPGDLTRIGAIFKVLDAINQTTIDQLVDSSAKAVTFNLEWIRSGNFYQHCQDINNKNQNFLKNLAS